MSVINHLQAEIGDARRTTQQWKAEHQAALIEIDNLRERMADLERRLSARDQEMVTLRARTASTSWVSVDDEQPPLGEPVILFANGVVQKETYVLFSANPNDKGEARFWARQESEDRHPIESNQAWQRLPSKPARCAPVAKSRG